MSTPRPFGGLDPNSQHQVWSRWRFSIVGGRRVPMPEVRKNGLRWLQMGFQVGSVGRVRFLQEVRGSSLATVMECEIEGKPAHDPDYVATVKRQFRTFVEKGWGMLAVAHVGVTFLAGDRQEGAPREQLLVMPTVRLLGEPD